MSTFKELTEKWNETKKQIIAEAKAAFEKAVAELFAKHPRLKEFSWTQYTPYWCDGDVCEFGANTGDLTFEVDGVDKEATDWISEYAVKHPQPPISEDPAVLALLGDTFALMKEQNEEFLKEMFGDHQKVTATASGVTSKDYEHD